MVEGFVGCCGGSPGRMVNRALPVKDWPYGLGGEDFESLSNVNCIYQDQRSDYSSRVPISITASLLRCIIKF
jgi:hypothetical protein